MTSEQVDLERRYLEFLDWPDVCAELALRAHSSRGVSACQTLPLCDSAEEAREHMAEVTEAVEILRMGESLPVLNFPEIEVNLRSVSQGIPLGPEELREVADFCEVVANARRFFGRIQPDGVLQTPRLSSMAATLGYHEDLVHLARETFDATGELRDSASPELARLRYEDQVFVSEFVRSHGSIKDMEKAFGISYPTVKNRLKRIIDQLQLVEVDTAPARDDTFDLLERGEITADEAAERLRR